MTKAPDEMGREDWTGEMGEKWDRYLDQFESMIEPAGAAGIEAANFRPGESVLDIGSGGAATTIAIASLIGPEGHVTGLDLSPTLTATARRKASEAGLTNADFICADAATARLDTRYQHLFSRFGVMFFEDPVAAFANIRSFGVSGAPLSFSCWAPPTENAWIAEPMAIAGRYVELPKPDPTAPGPFGLADPDRTTRILADAGFDAIEITAWEGPQRVGGAGATPAQAADFVMDVLFVGELLRDESDEVRASAAADVLQLLGKYATPRGVEVPAKIWLVSAVVP